MIIVIKVLLTTTSLKKTRSITRWAWAPCAIQYCYAHLLREVKNLEKELSDSKEVHGFVSIFLPLLTLAIGLRNQLLSPTQFHRKALEVKSPIVAAVESPTQHLGIRRIQDIFHQNNSRLYHWAEDRRVPAENNLAGIDLRPTVIARKVSFGILSPGSKLTRYFESWATSYASLKESLLATC